MDGQFTAPPEPKRRRGWLGPAGLVAAGLVAGGILAGSQIAGAAGSSTGTGTGTSSGTAATAAAGRHGTPPDPATVKHGPGETLLTGDAAARVTAAAQKAVPGATIIRVETDSGGAAYEAHMQKADGSYVTVAFDKNFNVTGTEQGFGGPGPGAPGAPAAPPSA